MLFINAYFDETGDEQDPNVYFSGFGGCISTDTEWIEFSAKWDRILADYDLPYFHCADFFQFQGEWKDGWKDDLPKCQELYRRLWNAIMHLQPIPVGCLIPLKPYREKLTKEQRKFLIDTYFVAFQTVIGMAYASLGDPKTAFKVGRIATIFDDKKGFQHHIQAFYDAWIESSPFIKEKTARPYFDDWRLIVPLQVADIIAYESHREYRRRLYSPEKPKKYGWQRLENLNRALGFGVGKLGDEESRIVFRPESYIDSIVESFTGEWPETESIFKPYEKRNRNER